jgi:hypothetical protein
MIRIACAVALLWGIAGARAETHRLAIVLGNNVGNGESPALHYAELDATKLSQALVELGGVEPADLYLLHGRTLAEVRAVFARAAAQVARWRGEPDARVVVVFYFSGHSDGLALELGDERLAFAQLRAWLAETGADVRVVIIDSCRSGALLATKGGRPGGGFQIRLSDSVASNGEALLTSSAADELALESREIHGSFFTHHLVSGLRGAADLSGDGNVTLGEAYQYAFARTVSATSATTYGPQHPAYDYRLTGEGELVLASSARPSAHLTLPDGFDRVLVVHLTRDQVLAEIPRGAKRTLAVPPGAYAVRAWRGGVAFAGRIAVREGEARAVRADELSVTVLDLAGRKGGLGAGRPAVSISSGWARGAGAGIDLVALSAALRGPGAQGWSLGLDVATGRGSRYRELQATALAGYFLSTRFGDPRTSWRGDVGLQLGTGLIRQTRDAGGSFSTATLAAVPTLGLATALTARLALRAEARLAATWLKRDDGSTLAFLPSGFLGLALEL